MRTPLEILAELFSKCDLGRIKRKYEQGKPITNEDLIIFYSSKAVLCLKKSGKYIQWLEHTLEEIDASNEIFANVYFEQAQRLLRKAENAKARQRYLSRGKNE